MKRIKVSGNLKDATIEEALRTHDPARVLRGHGAEAAQLRPLLELALALRELYAEVPEPPGRLAAGRRRMLAEADHLRQSMARDQAAAPSTSVPRRLRMNTVLAGRLLGIVLACALGTAALGAGGVAAAMESLPGSILYPAKLALETLRLEFAPSPQQQVALALGYADTRIAEMGQLEEQGNGAAEMAVARMESHLQYALDLAAQSPPEDVAGLLEQIMLRTQAQVQALQQLRAQAETRNQVQVERALRLCEQVNREAADGLQEPQAFRLRYQERAGMPDVVEPPTPASTEPGQGGDGATAGEGQQGGQQVQQQGGQQEQQQEQQREQQQEQQQQQVQQQEQQQEQQQQQVQQQEQQQVQQQGGQQEQQQGQQQNGR